MLKWRFCTIGNLANYNQRLLSETKDQVEERFFSLRDKLKTEFLALVVSNLYCLLDREGGEHGCMGLDIHTRIGASRCGAAVPPTSPTDRVERLRPLQPNFHGLDERTFVLDHTRLQGFQGS